MRVKGRLVYLLDGLGGLLGEVPQEALQDGPGDVLLELGLVNGGAVNPGVAAPPYLYFMGLTDINYLIILEF